MSIDPVCKMEVNEDQAAGTSERGGKKYYFCSPNCKNTFDQDPQRYAV